MILCLILQAESEGESSKELDDSVDDPATNEKDNERRLKREQPDGESKVITTKPSETITEPVELEPVKKMLESQHGSSSRNKRTKLGYTLRDCVKVSLLILCHITKRTGVLRPRQTWRDGNPFESDTCGAQRSENYDSWKYF